MSTAKNSTETKVESSVRRFKPYPRYKDSEIEWLGEVPADWSAERLRFYAEVNPVKSEVRDLDGGTLVSFVPMEAIGEDGRLCLDQTKAIDEVSTGYTYFRDGDVIVAKITPCFENGKGAIAKGLQNGIGFGTTELHVMRPGKVLDREYLFYLLMSHAFRGFGTAAMYGAGGQKRVPEDFIQDFKHPIPPIDDQKTIAAFLDRETERIDQLIARKERQIELLQEKRSALISHAVTKGLNPKAKMKDSGIEWLGEIPEHWEIRRLKYVSTVNDETLGEDTSPLFELLYIDIGSVDSVQGIVNKEVMVFEKAPSRARRIVRNGDIIVSTVRTYLRAIAPIVNPESNLIVSTGFAVVRPRYGLESHFAAYALRAPYFVDTIVSRSVGVSYPAINASDLTLIEIALPPLEEQRKIALHLAHETKKIDAIVSRVKDSIDKLREYRTALISSAVTGKIDVRKEEAI